MRYIYITLKSDVCRNALQMILFLILSDQSQLNNLAHQFIRERREDQDIVKILEERTQV